ncbi:Holliday junction resolvase RecU [Striga asiatica]|uniref:Holliday junction resolvase RecU n=1 Tax=Striga asiatica TaxID=4170 RepID=A0A5A7QWK5_STRAF|nr:Holliday junction resolvase RecU [Striga asiatica]
MEILLKKRVQFLLFVVGIIALSITAEKFRLLVGEEAASKSGKFTLLNCFDGSSGTLACVVKEGVKLYFYNIRTLHVESRRNEAIEAALADAVSQGLAAKEAAKVAQKEGAKAAKLATRKAKRIIGPIISSGWDFFEAIYFGGTITEGFLRGTGTLFGTYYVGFIAEERFGRFGYLVGSHLGSWLGGRVGLMVYDIVSGVHYMMEEGPLRENRIYEEADYLEKTDAGDENFESTWSGDSRESSNYEASADESFIAPEEL